MKKTKIVCTIGPASEREEILRQLFLNGMNVARLNFSHGNHEEHKKRIDIIKKLRGELRLPIGIMLDTKGPEIRLGNFSQESIELGDGDSFILTTRDIVGDESIVNVSYKGLVKDINTGNRILIDDGLVELKVVEILNDTDIKCTVLNGGTLKDHKGVNIPNVAINLPAVTKKDIEDIKFGIKNGIDFVAASFIRKAEDVLEIRKILEENGGEHIDIISKIENQEGVDNIDEIIKASDGIMVARGDLGVEIETEEIPLIQKQIIRKCNIAGKPVITATQMLDSMMRNPRPTRAEVTDVANAIYDGTDAIMLSGETAAGKYPVEAVKTMATIAKRIEETLDYDNILRSKGLNNTNVTDAISYATCTTAKSLTASGIVTSTSSGHTARMVSKFRPNTPIIAATPNERTSRQLSLSWGVYTVNCQQAGNTDDLIDNSIEASKNEGFIHDGELVVITAGVPTGVSGTTNLIKVHVVSEEICQGIGIGRTTIEGNVRIVKSGESCENFNEGDILVTSMTDKEMNPYIEKSAAIVTEDGGMTSHAAIVGINLGKPVIVSATNILSNVEDGEIITVDTTRGAVYRGSSRVL